MKQFLAALLGCMLLAGCASPAPSPWPEEPMRGVAAAGGEQDLVLLMSADLHYQPQPSESASALIPQVAYIGELLDCLVQETLTARPAALLLCGDLTNNGRLEEHQGLLELLAPLRAGGLPVYLLPGNHDLGPTTPEQFARLYADYGYSQALLRDESSLSYLVALDDQTWLLMLDSASAVGAGPEGGFAPATLAWTEGVLAQARAEDKILLTASHHPLLGHSSQDYNGKEKFFGSQEMAALLQGYRQPFHLAGHLHKQHLATRQGETPFTELTDGMLADYPHVYTRLNLSPATRQLDYQAVYLDVDGWAAANGLTQSPFPAFLDFSQTSRRQGSRKIIQGMLDTMEIPAGHKRQLADFFTQTSLAGGAGMDAQTLASQPGYALWQQYRGQDTRYSRWMDYLLEQARANNRTLTVTLP